MKKKLISLICLITLIIMQVSLQSASSSSISGEVAVDDTDQSTQVVEFADKISVQESYQNVINNYMNAINSQDPETLQSLYSPAFRAASSPFSEQNKKDRIGILAIDSITIEEIAEITANQAATISPYIDHFATDGYSDIRYFYVGFDMDVCYETDLYYNGVKYQVFKIGEADDIYSIVGTEYVYNFNEAVAVGCAFNSESERKAKNVVEQRHKYGRIVNFENEEITGRAPYVIKGTLDVPPIDTDAVRAAEEEMLKEKMADFQGEAVDIDPQVEADLEEASQGRNAIGPMSMAQPSGTILVYIESLDQVNEYTLDEYETLGDGSCLSHYINISC